MALLRLRLSGADPWLSTGDGFSRELEREMEYFVEPEEAFTRDDRGTGTGLYVSKDHGASWTSME